MIKQTFIYGLCEENNIIRYIGKSNNPNKRLKEHIRFSHLKKTYKDYWIQSVINKNKLVKLIILEKVNLKDWQVKEIFWINKYKNNKLTNHSKGGIGGRTVVYTKSYDKIKKWINNNIPHIKSKPQWNRYVLKNILPEFIPKNPMQSYKNRGWVSWGDFLNSKNKNPNLVNYINYGDAKKYIKKKSNKIKNEKEWKLLAKNHLIPNYIPNRPNRYYKNRGWISWGDFLGNNRISNNKKTFISYEDFIKWIIKNKISINKHKDWLFFCKSGKRPSFIPSNPEQIYKKNKEWISWNDVYKNIHS